MPDTPLNPAVVWNLRALADEGTRELRHVVLEPDLLHKLLDIAEAVAQPEVTSVEELDALPDGSVFIDDDGSVCQIEIDGESYLNGDPYRRFSMVGDYKDYELDEVNLPARVLYRPEVKP